MLLPLFQCLKSVRSSTIVGCASSSHLSSLSWLLPPPPHVHCRLPPVPRPTMVGSAPPPPSAACVPDTTALTPSRCATATRAPTRLHCRACAHARRLRMSALRSRHPRRAAAHRHCGAALPLLLSCCVVAQPLCAATMHLHTPVRGPARLVSPSYAAEKLSKL